MTTAVTINSLIRFNETTKSSTHPSPFDFDIHPDWTSTWVFERRPFSRTALTKVTDAFVVEVCRVFVPKEFMEEQKSMLHLQLIHSTPINRTIGPHIKNENIYGSTGVTGSPCVCGTKCIKCVGGKTFLDCAGCGYSGPVSCIKYPNDLPNYNETFPLYPANPHETPTHWIYESCGTLSMNEDWRGKKLRVVLRDECGYGLLPDGYSAQDLCAFDPCVVDDDYRALFQKDNQLMFVLNVRYVEFDGVGLEQCF